MVYFSQLFSVMAVVQKVVKFIKLYINCHHIATIQAGGLNWPLFSVLCVCVLSELLSQSLSVSSTLFSCWQDQLCFSCRGCTWYQADSCFSTTVQYVHRLRCRQCPALYKIEIATCVMCDCQLLWLRYAKHRLPYWITLSHCNGVFNYCSCRSEFWKKQNVGYSDLMVLSKCI